MGSTLQPPEQQKIDQKTLRGGILLRRYPLPTVGGTKSPAPELKMSLLSLSCPHLTFLVIFILSIFSAPPDDGGCD